MKAQGLIWAATKRCLTPSTLHQLGVVFDMDSYRDADGRYVDHVGARFYYADGHYKARSIKDKLFTASKGFKLRFWNLDNVIAGLKAGRVSRVYIFEGEIDACAAVEAGVSKEAVLSVPNGAKEKAANADNGAFQTRYQWVDDALAEGLNIADAIVWAGDNDGPGLALRSDMVRIFGMAKFHFVEFSPAEKDADGFLIKRGKDALLDALVVGAKHWPIEGLFRLDEIPEPPPMTLWRTRWDDGGAKIIMAPRCLSVATGHPGHGKTAFWTDAWFDIANRYGLVMCVASFETHIKPQMRRQLRTLHSGQLEMHMTPEQIKAADTWIRDHYLFVAPQDTEPTLKWLLNIAEAAVIRHGCSVVQVDPWNYLDGGHDPGKESETRYIGRCLREIRSFAKDLNVHFQVLAHPAKMGGERRGRCPVLEDISGSKNWDNAVDQGFAIHRPEMYDHLTKERKTGAELHYLKSRFVEELGYPCSIPLDYRVDLGRYELGVFADSA